MERYYIVFRGTGLQYLNPNGNWTKRKDRCVRFATEAEAWAAANRSQFACGVETVTVKDGCANFARFPKSSV